MKKAILATKVGMTQIFNEDGVLTAVTVHFPVCVLRTSTRFSTLLVDVFNMYTVTCRQFLNLTFAPRKTCN